MTTRQEAAPAGHDGDGRDETREERSDRNWNELLQELRVTQTGAQILTGFLLTLPFQQTFADLDDFQVTVYLLLVSLAALTTMLVVTPVSAHRLLFQRRLKAQLVRGGHRAALGGLACLALVVTGTILLIFDVVVGRGAALAAGGITLVLILAGWAVFPLVYGRRVEPRD
jgi:hypothetical protein